MRDAPRPRPAASATPAAPPAAVPGTPASAAPGATIVLRRCDPARNMQRYYRLSLAATLFGEWSCVREWGRIGHPGRIRDMVYPTVAEARTSLDRQLRIKEHRGYVRMRTPQAGSAAGHAPPARQVDPHHHPLGTGSPAVPYPAGFRPAGEPVPGRPTAPYPAERAASDSLL